MTMFPHRGIVADLCNSLFPMGLRNTETRYFVLCDLHIAILERAANGSHRDIVFYSVLPMTVALRAGTSFL